MTKKEREIERIINGIKEDITRLKDRIDTLNKWLKEEDTTLEAFLITQAQNDAELIKNFF